MPFENLGTVLIFTLAIVASVGGTSVADATETFTKAAEVKFMPAEEAATGKAIELAGTVTCVPDGWKGV